MPEALRPPPALREGRREHRGGSGGICGVEFYWNSATPRRWPCLRPQRVAVRETAWCAGLRRLPGVLVSSLTSVVIAGLVTCHLRLLFL